MPTIACRSKLIKELIELLELPKNCKGFTLYAPGPKGIVTVECEYYPDDNEKSLTNRKYRLEEID
jgi:hypothetical protein